MNKFFTKIAGLSLGLAMAIGVGVAVNSESVVPVKAATAGSNYVEGSPLTSSSTISSSDKYVLKSGSGYYYTGSISSKWGTTANSLSSAAILTLSGTQSGFKIYNTQTSKYLLYAGSDFKEDATGTSVTISSATITGTWAGTYNGLVNGTTGCLKCNTSSSHKFRWYSGTSYSATMIPLELVKVTPKLSSITLSGTYKTAFTVGDTFSFGGTVTATYADSTTGNVTTSTTFSGYNLNTAGNYTVTASYTENGVTKTATYSITVSAASTPTITLNGSSFGGYTGQTFSVTATYSNLTSAFAWSTSGSGTTTESISSTGSNTDGTSTYSGTLTGEGTKILTATGGGVQNAPTYTVTITQTTVNITKASTSIKQGKNETLAVSHNASSVDGLTWTSSDPSIADVDANGKVTVDSNATAGSTVTITARSKVDTSVADTCTVTVIEAPATQTVTYDFSQIEDFGQWSGSYEEHTVEYTEGTVTFDSADHNSQTITTIPVTKGDDVSFVAESVVSQIDSVTFVCTQWAAKTQTITLHYSTDGGSTYTSTGITSSNFTISDEDLPSGTNAVKITFSESGNQVGIASLTIVYEPSSTPVTKYNVFNSVSNGTLDVSKVSEGDTLVTTITPDTGYDLPESLTSVTMGGSAVQYTYTNGTITVANVTGDIEITGACVPEAQLDVTGDYVLLDNLSNLVENSLVIITNSNGTQAITTTQNSNNRSAGSSGLANSKISIASASTTVQIFKVESYNSGGDVIVAFYAYNGEANGYIYAASSSNNHLKTEGTLDANGKFLVALSSGTFSLTAQGTFTHNQMFYNGGSTLFSCYTSKPSGGDNVAIYIKSSSTPSVTHSVSFNSNGGSENPSQLTVADDGTFTFPSPGTNTGYNFAGWSSDGGTTKYGEGEESPAVVDDITYTAYWTQKQAVSCRAYTLVTDVDDLVDGGKIIITSVASNNSAKAISTTQSTNNRPESSAITVENGVALVESDDVEVITLSQTGEYWELGVEGGYLYSASNSSNHMKTQATNDANGEFTITIGNTGAATLVSHGTNSHNSLRYNSGNKLFSCYASGQSDVQIYKLSFEETLLHNVTCDGNGSHSMAQGFTWTTLKGVYQDLTSDEQLALKTASNDGLARYDYLIAKYGTTTFENFIGRSITPMSNGRMLLQAVTKNSGTTIAIVIISAVSLAAIGGYFLFRKKKEN